MPAAPTAAKDAKQIRLQADSGNRRVLAVLRCLGARGAGYGIDA
jgi:hypothetical protein